MLVMLAAWKPWEIKKLSVRERTYWVKHYLSIEERKRMDAVTQKA